MALACAGAQTVRLIDPDTVDASNIHTQGYKECQVGELKVTACKENMYGVNSDLVVSRHWCRWKKYHGFSDVVFVCVDSIKDRTFFWHHYQAYREEHGWENTLLVDGRMRGEAARVLSVADSIGRGVYQDSLFDPEEAYRGDGEGSCVQPGAYYCACAPMVLMMTNLTMWLRGIAPHADVLSNLIGADTSPVLPQRLDNE